MNAILNALELFERLARLKTVLGPSEITVFHPDVFAILDGPRSECIKSEWYDVIYPSRSLVTSRVKTVHAARRREWNRGFTSSGMCIFFYIERFPDLILVQKTIGLIWHSKSSRKP